MELTFDTWVVVADGTKYLVLRQQGDKEFMDLHVLQKAEMENPPAHELSSDRPGRMHDSVKVQGAYAARGKSALQETDWHVVEERRFAKELAEHLLDWAAADRFQKLVVVADPQTLGALRAEYGDKLQGRILLEIAKDLTNLPVPRIEQVLSDL
ncbi:baeRF12 domain-containing protein [Yoonia sp.]|uniref:baeRF12 domain-containing protein n=1 Tax=Yoonia sp. TaxID=2212373 RepID=UPI003F6A628B